MGSQQSDVSSVNLIYDSNNKEEKYQNFSLQQGNIQFSLPQYSNAEQVQQSPLELAKPDQAYNVQIPQIPQYPVVLQPYSQQEIQSHSNQSQQFNQTSTESTTNKILIKDLDFKTQAQQTMLSLFVLVAHQICLFFCFGVVTFQQEKYLKEYSGLFLLLFVPLYIVSHFLSSQIFFRRQPFPLIMFFSNIFLASEVLFFFCSLFSNERPPKEDGFYITAFVLMYIACSFLIIFNTVGIGIIIIYLCLEKQEIKQRVIVPVLGVIYLSAVAYSFYFFPVVIISYLYGIFLLLSIQQSFQGRFKLKKGEILSATNSYNFGIIFPFQTQKN